MSRELSKTYRPTEVETDVAARWDAAAAFHAEPTDPGKPYSIVIPPPNVTAALHMGHALNNTIQDILIRHHRMRGDNAMWMPGTDHAGIATQTVVEKRVLAEEGKRRIDFDRDTFVAKIQSWKDEYEQVITGQLKAMGCSCDWQRQRFTMDDICARAVREAFFQLFKDGLIYRGKRLVNWDPVTQTALADDEVEMHDVDGHFYYMKYPVVDVPPRAGSSPSPAAGDGPARDFVTVATTRPETMLGDTAVAVNPRDALRAHYIGKYVRLPIVNRIIPIIADEYVVIPDPDSEDAKAKYASGFLKVTPAHDPNDYEIGLRHNLPIINVLAPDGTISDQHGWPAEDVANADMQALPLGLDRYEAREAIVEWFRTHDLLAEVKPYRHAVGHSYRSHVPIEPYLSDQWYVKVTDDRLSGAALRAMADDQRSESNNDSEGGTGVPPVIGPKDRDIGNRLTIKHRHLPHWEMGGSTYFVTFRTQQGELTPEERLIVLNACLHWHESRLDAHLVTVMPDHVHLLITPRKKDDGAWWSLNEILHSIKSYTAHAINQHRGTSGNLWQDESFDCIVRDEEEFGEKWKYMWMNPVKAGLVDRPEDYAFVREGSAQRADDRRDACSTEHKPWESCLRFHPPRYAKTFQTWHENIRDWCISRQLWWGHRIPVWSKRYDTFEQMEAEVDGPLHRAIKNKQVAYTGWDEIEPNFDPDNYGVYVCLGEEDEQVVSTLTSLGFTRDPDVLDTWFSSALWPMSTLSWPEDSPELATWNPTNVLCTAREIITLWVSRMVMFNLYFLDRLPFHDVFIHAMIQDGEGRKMSKTLGNGVDPLDIIHSHGSDAMRYTLAAMTTNTQDVRMPVTRDPQTQRNTSEKFDAGRNFANKLWNAVRFALTKLESSRTARPASAGTRASTEQTSADAWILARLAATIRDTTTAIERYEFADYAKTLYDFFWRDLCDWYIEAVKPTVEHNARQQAVLGACLDASLRLLHPVMPFITEKLWEHLNEVVPQRGVAGIDLPSDELLIKAHWPRVDAVAPLEDGQSFAMVQEIVSAIRQVRTQHKVAPRTMVDVSIQTRDVQAVQADQALIENLANVKLVTVATEVARPADAAAATRGDDQIYLHKLIDAEAERARLTRRGEELSRSISALNGRLANKSYAEKAPAHLVQQTRDQLAEAQREYESVREQLAALN